MFHRAYLGGAGEVGQVVPALEALVAMAAERTFLLVGDSKLVSYSNLAAMIDAGVSFIASASKSYVGAEIVAGCVHGGAFGVDHVAQRDQDKAADDRGRCQVAEDTMVLANPENPTRNSACVGCSCGPRRAPAARSRPEPRNGTGPEAT